MIKSTSVYNMNNRKWFFRTYLNISSITRLFVLCMPFFNISTIHVKAQSTSQNIRAIKQYERSQAGIERRERIRQQAIRTILPQEQIRGARLGTFEQKTYRQAGEYTGKSLKSAVGIASASKSLAKGENPAKVGAKAVWDAFQFGGNMNRATRSAGEAGRYTAYRRASQAQQRQWIEEANRARQRELQAQRNRSWAQRRLRDYGQETLMPLTGPSYNTGPAFGGGVDWRKL